MFVLHSFFRCFEPRVVGHVNLETEAELQGTGKYIFFSMILIVLRLH